MPISKNTGSLRNTHWIAGQMIIKTARVLHFLRNGEVSRFGSHPAQVTKKLVVCMYSVTEMKILAESALTLCVGMVTIKITIHSE